MTTTASDDARTAERFPTLTGDPIRRGSARGVRRAMRVGEVIFEQGDVAKHVHVLIRALDEQGFIKTGTDLSPKELARSQWPLPRAPFHLETNRPLVFAVGNVRSGNVKRVASAVGEGSVCVQLVFRALAQ